MKTFLPAFLTVISMQSFAGCAVDSSRCNDTDSDNGGGAAFAVLAVVAVGAFAFYELKKRHSKKEQPTLLSHNPKTNEEQNLMFSLNSTSTETPSLDFTVKYKF